MNERIKQLLAQVYDDAVPETWTTLSSEQQVRIYDKFAELIVIIHSVKNMPELKQILALTTLMNIGMR